MVSVFISFHVLLCWCDTVRFITPPSVSYLYLTWSLCYKLSGSSGCSYPTGASAVGTMTPTTGGAMGGATAGTFTPGAGGMGTGTATGTAGTGFGGLGPGTDASMDTAAAAGLLLPPRAGGLAAALVALLLSAMVLA